MKESRPFHIEDCGCLVPVIDAGTGKCDGCAKQVVVFDG